MVGYIPYYMLQPTESPSYLFTLSYLFYIADRYCTIIVLLSRCSRTCDTEFWDILVDAYGFAQYCHLLLLYLTNYSCTHDFPCAKFFI